LFYFSIKPEEIIFKNVMAGALEHANNLSEAFDVDIRPILERAADQQLSARKFEEATQLYRLSKVNKLSIYSILYFFQNNNSLLSHTLNEISNDVIPLGFGGVSTH